MPTALQSLQTSLNSMFGVRPARKAKPTGPRDPHRKAREAAKKLAAKHGITIEKENHECRGFWVTYAPWMDTEHDVLEGEHFCMGWDEVLDAVRVYAKALEAQS